MNHANRRALRTRGLVGAAFSPHLSWVAALLRPRPRLGAAARGVRAGIGGTWYVRTPAASILSGIIVLVALYGLTPAFYWVPTAGLSAVIIHAVADLVTKPPQVYKFCPERVSLPWVSICRSRLRWTPVRMEQRWEIPRRRGRYHPSVNFLPEWAQQHQYVRARHMGEYVFSVNDRADRDSRRCR